MAWPLLSAVWYRRLNAAGAPPKRSSPCSPAKQRRRARYAVLALAGDREAHRPQRLAGGATGADLNAEPRIRLFTDLVDDNICAWLIDRAQGRLARALVYDALSKITTENPTRTNTAAVFNLLDTDFVCVLVQLRMAASLGKSIRYFEPITVLHYDEGEQITEHYDFVDPNVPDYDQEIAQKGQRVVTFLIYLNDDYAGGETEFPRSGVSHKGRRREGLYFVNALPGGSADIRTLHAGRAPRNGEKWIVSQFVRDRPLF